MASSAGELKPCPFCGDEATVFEENDEQTQDLVPVASIRLLISSSHTYYGVRCCACDIGMTNPFRTAEHAIAAWNRRAPASPETETKEAHDGK